MAREQCPSKTPYQTHARFYKKLLIQQWDTPRTKTFRKWAENFVFGNQTEVSYETQVLTNAESEAAQAAIDDDLVNQLREAAMDSESDDNDAGPDLPAAVVRTSVTPAIAPDGLRRAPASLSLGVTNQRDGQSMLTAQTIARSVSTGLVQAPAPPPIVRSVSGPVAPASHPHFIPPGRHRFTPASRPSAPLAVQPNDHEPADNDNESGSELSYVQAPGQPLAEIPSPSPSPSPAPSRSPSPSPPPPPPPKKTRARKAPLTSPPPIVDAVEVPAARPTR